MRYYPDTNRAVNIDEIAAQCRAAITASEPAPKGPRWGDMAKRSHQRLAYWGAGHMCSIGGRQHAENCQLWHDADVAAAFGDYRRAEQIRRQIAGLY